MIVKDMLYTWSWLALCPIDEAMFVEGCCYKGAARPLTRSAKKRRVARYVVFAFVFVGACVLGGCCGVSPLLHFHRTASSWDSEPDILHAFTGVEKGFV